MADPTRYIHRYSLPQIVERGADKVSTVLAEIRLVPSGDPAFLVSAGWTYAIYAGSRLVYESTTITAASPFLSHSVPGSALASEPLSDRLQERWTGTISGNPDQVFTRPLYLVRHALNQAISDDDLFSLHSDLADLRDPDQADYGAQRQTAWDMLQKWLIFKGNRPQLIMDDWALVDVHRFLSLAVIFGDFAQSVGDGRYRELADQYREKAREEFNKLQFAYDWDEDGTHGAAEEKAANPVFMLQKPWGWDRWC